MNIRLPTSSARRIIFRRGLNDRFSDEDGNKSDAAWHDAISSFQRMLICGTDKELASKSVKNCLYFDPQLPEDQNEEIERDLLDALHEIAELTLPEVRALVLNELAEVAASRGGGMSWFDGKAKLDSIVKIIEMTQEGGNAKKELDGLIFKVMQTDA